MRLLRSTLFWETSWIEDEQNRHEFCVGDEEVDIETYAKDLQSFVNTYERMDEARKYQDVSFISNWETSI